VNLGRIALEFYILFQHHTTLEILRSPEQQQAVPEDLWTASGNGWHFSKYLGASTVVLGLDCRNERNQGRVSKD
jgi:hypothetical protein